MERTKDLFTQCLPLFILMFNPDRLPELCPQCGATNSLRLTAQNGSGVYGTCLLLTISCQACSFCQKEQNYWVVNPEASFKFDRARLTSTIDDTFKSNRVNNSKRNKGT